MCISPTLGSVHLPSFVSNHPSWHAYLHAMGQDGTWGDHLTLIAVANMYHVSIVIVSSVEDIQPIVINPESGQSEGTILLGHIAELHYVTLQPVVIIVVLYCNVQDKKRSYFEAEVIWNK